MPAWNRNQVTSFFPNFSNAHRHRGIGGDWRMNIAFPPVNVKKKDKEFEITLATPGYSKEDFKIESKDGHLIISAKRSAHKEEETDEYIHREYDVHAFEREIRLPDHSVEQEIKASYRHGMLRILVPREKDDVDMPSLVIPID